MVVACPFGQFDSDRFYDSEYVRQYRQRLMDYVRSGRRGFGVQLTGKTSDLKFKTVANNVIVTYSAGKVQVETTISVSKEGGVVQSTVLATKSIHTVELDYTLALNISVNRASYGQLTEGGPIPIPRLRNEFKLFEGSHSWAVINRNLDATIQGALYCDGLPVCLELMTKQNTTLEQPVSTAFHGTIQIFPGQMRTLTSTYRLQPGTGLANILSPLLKLEPSRDEGWEIKNETMSLIIRGNLSYILGNCTIPISQNATCLITDHVALPLGWNRDN